MASRLDTAASSILDVGCGYGEPMLHLRRHHVKGTVIAVDIFLPYLKLCRARGTHDGFVQANALHLPFQDKSFDVVLCLEVLEHVGQEEGDRFLHELERIARKQVIVSTPCGPHFHQEPFDDNPYQLHQSAWLPEDLEVRGYRVITLGLRGIQTKMHRDGVVAALMRPLYYLMWAAAGPITRVKRSLAGDLLCIKTLEQSGAHERAGQPALPASRP